MDGHGVDEGVSKVGRRPGNVATGYKYRAAQVEHAVGGGDGGTVGQRGIEIVVAVAAAPLKGGAQCALEQQVAVGVDVRAVNADALGEVGVCRQVFSRVHTIPFEDCSAAVPIDQRVVLGFQLRRQRHGAGVGQPVVAVRLAGHLHFYLLRHCCIAFHRKIPPACRRVKKAWLHGNGGTVYHIGSGRIRQRVFIVAPASLEVGENTFVTIYNIRDIDIADAGKFAVIVRLYCSGNTEHAAPVLIPAVHLEQLQLSCAEAARKHICSGGRNLKGSALIVQIETDSLGEVVKSGQCCRIVGVFALHFHPAVKAAGAAIGFQHRLPLAVAHGDITEHGVGSRRRLGQLIQREVGAGVLEMGRGTAAAAAALLLVVVPVVHDGAVIVLAGKTPQVGLGGGKGIDGVPFQGVQLDGDMWGAGGGKRPGGVAGAGVVVVHRHPGIAVGQLMIEGDGLDGAGHRLADRAVHLHGDGGLEVIGARAAAVVQALEIAAGQAADAVLQAPGQGVLVAVKGGAGGAVHIPARPGVVVILRADELRVAAVLIHPFPLVGDGILAIVEIGRIALGQRAGFGAEAGLEAVGVQGVSAGQAGFTEVGILGVAAEPLIAVAEAGLQPHALVRAVGGGVDHQHRGQGLGVHGLARAALVHKGGDEVIKAQLVAAAQSEGQLLRRIIDAAAVIHGLLPQQQLRQLLAAVCRAVDVALMAVVIGPHAGEDDGVGVVGGAAAVQGQFQRGAVLPPGQADHRAQAVFVSVGIVIVEGNGFFVLVRAAQGDDVVIFGGRLRHRGGVVEPIGLHLGVGAAVGVLAVSVDELHGLFIVRSGGRPGQIDLRPVGHRH